jgi:hypothetical protein
VRHYLKEQLYARLEENGPLDLDPFALREHLRGLLKQLEPGSTG